MKCNGYECRICHGIFDAGELNGNVCQECLAEQEEKERLSDRILKMSQSAFCQMEIFLAGTREN